MNKCFNNSYSESNGLYSASKLLLGWFLWCILLLRPPLYRLQLPYKSSTTYLTYYGIHIMPLVINSLRGRYTQKHIPTSQTKVNKIRHKMCCIHTVQPCMQNRTVLHARLYSVNTTRFCIVPCRTELNHASVLMWTQCYSDL